MIFFYKDQALNHKKEMVSAKKSPVRSGNQRRYCRSINQ